MEGAGGNQMCGGSSSGNNLPGRTVFTSKIDKKPFVKKKTTYFKKKGK